LNGVKVKPSKYPARQTLEASQALARLHKLDPEKTIFIQQNPAVIDQGVFHNDVISVGNLNTLFYHEEAFLGGDDHINDLKSKMPNLIAIKVNSSDVSVAECVKTYLFNTQLLQNPDGEGMCLIAPYECRDSKVVAPFLENLIKDSDHPITAVHYFDVKQSMQNGGGPACLRLRVVLNEDEFKAINPHCLLNDEVYEKLKLWIQTHYRDELSPVDLGDIALLNESRKALEELSELLQLGNVYPFLINN
jgi:succinylarginine dihydrolase